MENLLAIDNLFVNSFPGPEPVVKKFVVFARALAEGVRKATIQVAFRFLYKIQH